MAAAVKILNVDDHEPSRYAKTRILQKSGYQVEEAANGVEALQRVSHFQPDLVVLDVHLPDINGLDVCRRIKDDPAACNTTVLQISAAKISGMDRVRGLDNGADSYLIEPVEPAILLATVRALLRMRQAEADVRQANTALERANEALRVSNEELKTFTSIASHDLQEPLRTLTSYTQLLQRRLNNPADAETQQILDYIVSSAVRMRRLITDLLDYSYLATGEVQPFTEVPLTKVVEWAKLNLDTAVAESQAVITLDPLPTVQGQEGQLSQLFQNLLSNALKYRRPQEKPTVHVGAQRDGSFWRLSVTDNGIGISPEYREQIFRPFQRLHGREIPGTGIGLALCRRIVERHGGRIWAEAAPEHGTLLRFTLPAQEPHCP